MNNPFIQSSKNGKVRYLTPQCSINKLVIKKLPIYGLDDEIEGKPVNEIFSTQIILTEIEKYKESLGADPNADKNELFFFLQAALKGEEESESFIIAKNIVKKFGVRLGIILLTLKTGNEENKKERQDWTNAHWDYWHNIKSIILVGGLTSGTFGELLIEYAKQVFDRAAVEPYDIIVFENATHVGTMGCAKLITNPDGWNVVMDFGQTNIKRSVIKRRNNEIADVVSFSSMQSQYMQLNIDNEEEKREIAFQLHKYLINAIVKTYKESEKLKDVNIIGDEIIISIASYIVDGKLNDERGGYAKLATLYPNYAECLSEEVSGRLKRQVKVKLVHDGTAVALHFSDYKNAVCITLGTYFGVGFPDI